MGPALSPDANPGQMDAARRVSEIYTAVAQSRPLLTKVVDELELAMTADALGGQVSAETLVDPPIITITAVSLDPDAAAEIANEVAQQLIATSPSLQDEEQDTQQFLARQIEVVERDLEALTSEAEQLSALPSRTPVQDERLAALQSVLTDLRATYASLVAASSPGASNQLTLLEEAVPDLSPLPGARGRATIAAALIGLVIATAFAFVIEHLDDTLKSQDDIERVGGIRNLATIPRVTHPSHATVDSQAQVISTPGAAERFRALRTTIDFATEPAPSSVLVTSADPGDGKTTVAVNLAVVNAQAGRRVLLVDANLRHPELHSWMGLSNDRGLRDLLEESGATAADLIQQARMPGLRVLTAGERHPSPVDLMDTQALRQIMLRLREPDLVIIVDGPAALADAETPILAAAVETTLVVVAAGRTSAPSLVDTYDVLVRAKANIIGTVLNHAPRSTRPSPLARKSVGGSETSAEPRDERLPSS